jgi:[protein-PII] uridylyltransferase
MGQTRATPPRDTASSAHGDPAASETRARLAAVLAEARDEYAADARRGAGGTAVLARYADRIDGLVRGIASGIEARTAVPVVVAALGGYGRRTLYLHSDIDLLIAFDGTIGDAEERAVNALLQPLWDLRLTVGQHVREAADFDRTDLDNPEFFLALLDARPLAGDELLLPRLLDRMRQTGSAWTGPLLSSLLSLVAQRHAQFSGTLYQLEPDIKNAPGALRDISVARHISRLRPDPFATEIDRTWRQVPEAEEFFARIRSVLHLENGRDVNLLTHELQEKVAEVLGCTGDDPRQRVESLMGEYFRHARLVARTLARAESQVQPPPQRASRPVGRYFEAATTGMRFVDVERAASQPVLWLEIFRAALANSCAVSEQAQTIIEQNVDRYTAADFLPTDAQREQLRRMLHPRPGLYARLSEMHDCGLLSRLFPEFALVHCRVVRDFYHKYTVDEHSLLAIRTIESLWSADTPSRQRFGAILHEVHAPELLTLALLLHDVGKWQEADHAVESLRLAQSTLDRLKLAPEARQMVEFLIRNHLQMSQVAFRRDAEDPQVVARFADIVGTEEQLKMLCLMTLADVAAVSPDTLTPWKEELLWRVYVDTYNRLTLGYADELLDQTALAGVVAGRPTDISEEELTRFLNGLPRRYLALFGLPSIYRHVRLARGIRRDEVHAFLEKHEGDVWELTVVTLDKPYLFSNVSGVLSYFGMDIHRGQAMTTPDGLVLDVFEFSDDASFLRKNPGATSDVYRMLENVVAGSVDVPALLQGKERNLLYRRRQALPPVVRFDNEHSRRYTVLEIIADDAPGLLYRISRAVSSRGCDVDLVLIATEGKRAVDVLHVTTAGKKLSEADQAALRQQLETTLEDRHETH